MKSIGFIGTGNMAAAIIKGISKSNLDAKLYGYDIDQTKLMALGEYGLTPADTVISLCNISDYLFLSVKPQSFADILGQIKDKINPDTIIISIAAGISSQLMREKLGFEVKIVRVMPNTPLMLGLGATALSKTDNVTDGEFEFAQEIFNCAGITRIVPASKMNEIIAINGSSPAFIYEFVRCFMEYGKSVGLDSEICLQLFAQTLVGSAKMITDSGNTIEELITMVSSKGGTTIAGLEAFKQLDLQATVDNACKKCTARAYELEQELSR